MLFGQQVRQSPAAPALVKNGETISYQELDRRSDIFAQSLLQRRLQPEARVGVLAGRSASMVTALIGVLKAGGCYVPMYTSGSTDVPKGVMIEHRSVARLIMSADYADADDRKRVILMGAIGFDATTFEIWWPLLNGGTLHLVDDAIRLHATHLTENTVFSTCCVLKPEDIESIPIGTLPRFCSVHVADEQLRRLPDGETGELLLGGEQLARGYLNQPHLTRERFVEVRKIGRVYRSGDLGFRRLDGRFEFVGRKDQQVKVKGYRIDPGEIESELRALPGISDAAVRVVAHKGEKQLASYFVAPNLDTADIR